jgi:hypothetical protein
MKTNTGYYTVGTTIFTDKLSAILHASVTSEEVTWHFNDEIYKNVDWTTEPELSIDHFYKIRAQQIRDEYDYVIILCSGGGDSTNVVWSFLNNGIHVDEVVASAPISGLSSWEATNKDTSAGNTMSETMLAQLPLMHEIHSKYPDVKITINDYFETLLDYQTDDWIFRCGEWIHPSSGARYDLDKQAHIKLLAEQGKKIAIVYGIDKPHLYYDVDNTVNIMMSDLTVNVQRPPFKDKYPNVENVLFYFAPDLPQMQVKQAHMLAKWIHLPDNKFAQEKMLDHRKPPTSLEKSRHRHSFYERAIIPCIYPTTHRRVFQGHKPSRMFLGEHDDWFYKMHNNTRAFDLIVSDFRNFIKEINPMYLNGPRTGFKVYQQKYKLGPISDFIPLIEV